MNITEWVTFVSQTMRVLYDLAERQAGYFTPAAAMSSGRVASLFW